LIARTADGERGCVIRHARRFPVSSAAQMHDRDHRSWNVTRPTISHFAWRADRTDRGEHATSAVAASPL